MVTLAQSSQIIAHIEKEKDVSHANTVSVGHLRSRVIFAQFCNSDVLLYTLISGASCKFQDHVSNGEYKKCIKTTGTCYTIAKSRCYGRPTFVHNYQHL